MIFSSNVQLFQLSIEIAEEKIHSVWRGVAIQVPGRKRGKGIHWNSLKDFNEDPKLYNKGRANQKDGEEI